MKHHFTTIYDGTNINVSNLRAYNYRHIQKALFSGAKYLHCCFKLMIGITFMGQIVHYTGLHIGTMPDNIILDKYPPKFEDWEWGIGDGAFGSNQQIMIAPQMPPGGVLSAEDLETRFVFNHWRVRVEHIVAELKNHDILSGVFRGSYPILKSATDIIVHMTNIKLKLSLPRYETLGPWSHVPEP